MNDNHHSASPACAAYADLIPLAGQRLLDMPEQTALQEHITTCRHCQAELVIYTHVDNTLRRMNRGTQRPFSRAELLQMITASEATKRNSRRATMSSLTDRTRPTHPSHWIWAAASVVVAASLIFGTMFFANRVKHTSSTLSTPSLNMGILTPDQTWGAAAIASFPLGPITTDTTTNALPPPTYPSFIPTDIAPDGSVVVGYAVQSSTNGIAVAVAIDAFYPATKSLHQIELIDSYPYILNPYNGNPVTNGRFVAWQALEVTNGITQDQLKYLDLRSGKITVITTLSDQDGLGQFTAILMSDQGILIWGKENATGFRETLEKTDLITGQTTDLESLPPFNIEQLCWPYLLISNQLLNVESSKSLALPDFQDMDRVTCDGSTVFLAHLFFQRGYESVQMEETSISKLPGASWQQGDTIPYLTEPQNFVGVDNRLFLFWSSPANTAGPAMPLIWDRFQKRLIAVSSLNDNAANATLHGNWLVYLSKNGNQAMLNVVDTTKLPTVPQHA
jgi:hypothetical protein